MIFFLLPLFLLLSIPNSLTQTSKKCLALALEGGGDAGSWQAGVIYGLVSGLPPEEVEYDVISGVSVGSLNGIYVATYAKGDEKIMAEELLYRWGNITQEDIYIPWGNSSLNMWRAFYDQPSLYDNGPLKIMIDKYLKGKTIKRKLSIGITDATNVESVTYDIENFPNENITQLILDSTAIPLYFPYSVFDNSSIFMDGGVLLNVNVESAVRRCKELGFDENQIILDVILPNGCRIKRDFLNQTGYDMYNRYQEIVDYTSAMDDILHAFYDFKYVNFRYIILPEHKLIYDVPLDFNHLKIMKKIELGKKDAKNAIENKNNLLESVVKKRRQRVVKYINSTDSNEEGKKGFLEIISN